MNKEIWLAGGCFWGVEEYFSRIDGVVDTSEKQKEPSPLLPAACGKFLYQAFWFPLLSKIFKQPMLQ